MRLFCRNELPVARICDALEHRGALALPLLDDQFRIRLLAHSRLYQYRPARKEVGRDHERVRQRMDVEPNFRPHSLFHKLSDEFQKLFDDSLSQTRDRQHQFTEPVDFNDLMLQRYTIGDVGITPHRDRTSYRSIVVLFVLCGRGRFGICKDRDADQFHAVANGPGDIILMRAPGFVSRDGENLPRPFHFVDRITEPRYVFGLRDDVDKRTAPASA